MAVLKVRRYGDPVLRRRAVDQGDRRLDHFEIARHFGDGLMCLSLEGPRFRTMLVGSYCGPVIRKTLVPAPYHRVHASQKPNSTFDTTLGPAQLIFHRRCKENKQTSGVRAKGSNHFIRIDTVAQTLGHCFPFIGAFYPQRANHRRCIDPLESTA